MHLARTNSDIQCDEGTPCQRCMMKSQKGQTYFFDCDRSKLPDFVHDFLPRESSLPAHRKRDDKTQLTLQPKPR